MDIKTKFDNTVAKIIDKVTASGVMQEETTATGENLVFENMPELIRSSANEGMVLLKNEGILPIKEDKTVSLFGRCQRDYFYVGYGSGGDVNAPYFVNPVEGLENAGIKLNKSLVQTYKIWCEKNPVSHGYWGHWPMNYPEMPVTAEIANASAQKSDIAVVILGRAAGEDRENKLEKGSYYLTDTELDMLDNICNAFDEVAVIMDCGNIIDMSWTLKYGERIKAILYAWQCGMESGNALGDVLSGKVNPSGSLSDTIAVNYEDYPSADNFGGKDYNEYCEDIFVGYRYFETFDKSKVLYPFGFGLSYTDFEITDSSFKFDADKFNVTVSVKNVGDVSGKKAVQLYLKAPQGKHSKAERSLVAFGKTSLLSAGETDNLNFSFTLYDISTYDDTGVTGEKSSYVIEPGNYEFFAGFDVRGDYKVGEVELGFQVTERCHQACAPQRSFDKITAREVDGKLMPIRTSAYAAKPYLRQRILDNMPVEIGYRENTGEKLEDVVSGKITLDDFIKTLTNEELEVLSRGQGYMNSEHGVEGNAGAFGGTSQSLIEKGVLPIITTDGPAGIRIKRFTSLIPCGTALACTMNTALVEELAKCFGREMVFRETDVILAPGMNIHRNVLCGRNFEYFSEDPVLSGYISAAFVNGIQSNGVSACPKHFACNNQETKRTKTDTVITERALREIYLKGFEICVKNAKPMNIMTSYNKINGVWNHYNFDLVKTILRDEWDFDGNVMTDWWMQKSKSPEFPVIRDNAYRVRSRVNVLMPGGKQTDKKYKSDGTLLKTLGKPDGITRAELEENAKPVLELVIKLKMKG